VGTNLVLKLVNAYLGIKDLPEQAQNLVHKGVFLVSLLDFAWFLSTSFYVLFVIDMVGIEKLGVLLAVSFLLQAVLDYPSGALGDWIGQRWILFIGFSLEALAYGFLIFANSFVSFLVVYVIRAIAYSQQSGAILTWFENNYKVAANETDPQRTTFKFLFGRWNSIMFIMPGIAVATGGMLATIFSRKTVFLIQVIALAIMAVIFLILITDFQEIERPQRSIKRYFQLLGEGIRFSFLNKIMLLFLIGIVIMYAISTVFMEILLFPMLYGYTGTDIGAGSLRFIILIIGTFSTYYAANVAKNLDIKWATWALLLDIIVYYGVVSLLTAIYPIERNIFTPVAIAAIILTYILHWFLVGIFNILIRSIYLDLIPDKIRNSIYSLIPTLILIVSAPASIMGAWIIDNFSVSAAIFLMGLFSTISVIFIYLSLKKRPDKDPGVSAHIGSSVIDEKSK
jgi:MFS family permease